MKRLMFCMIALALSGSCGLVDARPTKREPNQAVRKELLNVVRRIENLVRSGSAVDASNVLADAILQCLYNSIKIDLAAILAKACTIESSIDGILFTIVDSVDNAAQSLSFTICEKLEPLQPGISFTVCDAVRFVQENLSFTIADGISNAGASLAFTVCDKVENSCEELKFTVVDKVGNMVASLGFTICDAFANALPGNDEIAGLVINKVQGAQESLAFTICDKLQMVAEDAASMLDKACSILDQLPIDPIDLAPVKYTVCDKAETLSSKIDDLELCFPTPITEDDFLMTDGALRLPDDVPSVLQSYCFAEDVRDTGGFGSEEATLSLNADDITVDLNGHKLEGRIIINGDRCVVKNGFLCPKAPAPGFFPTLPSEAAIEIFGDKAQVLNCVIQNTDSDDTDPTVLDGRLGMLITATEAKVAHCCIRAGSANTIVTTGSGGDGGKGILLSNAFLCRIIDCEIQSGNGSGAGGASLISGDGGDGICLNASDDNCIINCIIMTGSSAFGENAGGRGGHGILLRDSDDNIIRDCSIKQTGDGGTTLNDSGDGDGGHGVFIESTSMGNKVFRNTIAHTGEGGVSQGLPGRAINDLNSLVLTISGATAAFDNFAYDIADTAVRYNIHATGVEAGQDLAMPPDNLANVFVP